MRAAQIRHQVKGARKIFFRLIFANLRRIYMKKRRVDKDFCKYDFKC